jgi:diketogulonate reductase-like aldo/keto reductase
MVTTTGHVYRLNNEVEMPVLGLGVFRSEPEKTVSAVRSAVAAGYRLIDTAALYMNEQQVGDGVRSSGLPRKEIFITTKLWISDYGYEQALRAFDRSLRKLGLDFLDLYLLHWPVPSAFETTIQSYKAAMKLLADGRVRAIGVCNFAPSHLDKLVEQTGHVPAVNQVELHPFFNQHDVRQTNGKHGVITQAWSPIGGVNRYGAKAAKEAQAVRESHDPLLHPTVLSIARKYQKTPAQVVLRWQIELGNSPIPKSVHAERIAENIDVFDFSLASEEVQAIDLLDTGERGGPNPEQVDSQTFRVTIPD